MRRTRRPRGGLLAVATILGGVLIVVGSQWRVTQSPSLLPGRPDPTEPNHLQMSPIVTSYAVPHVHLATWDLIFVVLCGIVVASLGAELAAATPRRASYGWALLVTASVVTAYAAYLGLSIARSSSVIGPGYVLLVAGCGLALVGSGVWTRLLRAPQASLHRVPVRSR